jgi:predicted ester cyclase
MSAPPSSVERNRAAVRRFYAALNGGDPAEVTRRAEELADPALRMHSPLAEGQTGPAGLVEGMLMLRRAFPDLRLDVQDVIAEGDRVVARVVVTGTHQGEHMGVAPTGRRFTIDEIAVFGFRDAKAVEIWGVVDVFSQMRQLGVLSA